MSDGSDGIRWGAHALVEKYSGAQVAAAVAVLGHEPDGAELHALFARPDDGTAEAHGNLLTTGGVTLLTGLIIGAGGNAFNNADAIVGVGNSTTTAVVADTALGADNTANAWYQGADSANPTRSAGVITCIATFTTGNANFAWQEWCFAAGSGTITPGDHLSAVSTSPIMINHKIQSLGTKTSGSWVLTATLTLS